MTNEHVGAGSPGGSLPGGTPLWLLVLRWSGRVLAVAVFLFWGAFFVEHLQEWFFRPLSAWPPPRVCLSQMCHLLLLASLAALWRWEIAGSVLTLVAAFVFFGQVAGPRFLAFFSLTSLPALMILVAGWQTRRLRAGEGRA